MQNLLIERNLKKIRFVKIVNHFLFTVQLHDEKNIRRRVYDALNVLMALNIISKDKKEIKWRGLPLNYQQEYENLLVLFFLFIVYYNLRHKNN